MSLESDEENNYNESLLLPSSPVEIHPGTMLASKLQTDSFFFRTYEITACMKPADDPRFLATMGIFTCVAVFAWSSVSKKAFAAHVPTSACHYAINQQTNAKKSLLPEITHYLKWVFRKEQMSDITVHFVGGQKIQDADQAFKRHFSGVRCSFAWHLKQAVLDAGVLPTQVNDRLLNVFEGIPFDFTFEVKQADRNQSFHLVALDRENGAIVVHTETTISGQYFVPALGSRGKVETRRYVEGLHQVSPFGQKCVYVNCK